METIFERMGSLATLLDDELQTIETRFRVLSTSSQSHFDGPAKKVVECQREIESLKKDIDGLIHVADEQYKHFDGFLKRIIDRLSTIPEMPSQATSVEEFHKVLEQSTRSSSPSKSSSLITSPIQVPVKLDKEVSEDPREIPSLMENQRQPDMIIQPTIDDAFKELNISELSEGPLEHESTMLDESNLFKVHCIEKHSNVDENKIKNDLSEGPLDDSSPMLDQRNVSKIDIPNEKLEQLDESQLSKCPLENLSPMHDQRQVPKIDILDEDALAASPMLDQKELSKIELSEGPLHSEDSLEQLSLSEGPILDQSVSVMQGNADKNSSSSLMASSSASLTTCSSLSKSEHLSEGQIVMSVELSEGELKASSDSLDD